MPGPLTWMIFLPVLTAAAAAVVDRRRESSIRVIGLTGTAMVFLLAAWVWAINVWDDGLRAKSPVRLYAAGLLVALAA